MDSNNTEVQIKNIRAYDKGCIGCKKFKKHVMISFTPSDENIIYDLFLTEEQAKEFSEELNKKL